MNSRQNSTKPTKSATDADKVRALLELDNQIVDLSRLASIANIVTLFHFEALPHDGKTHHIYAGHGEDLQWLSGEIELHMDRLAKAWAAACEGRVILQGAAGQRALANQIVSHFNGDGVTKTTPEHLDEIGHASDAALLRSALEVLA